MPCRSTHGTRGACVLAGWLSYRIQVRPTVGRLNADAPIQSCHCAGQILESLKTLASESPETGSRRKLLASSKAFWQEEQLNMGAGEDCRT